jgi:hypothetical protein
MELNAKVPQSFLFFKMRLQNVNFLRLKSLPKRKHDLRVFVFGIDGMRFLCLYSLSVRDGSVTKNEVQVWEVFSMFVDLPYGHGFQKVKVPDHCMWLSPAEYAGRN